MYQQLVPDQNKHQYLIIIQLQFANDKDIVDGRMMP